MIAVGPTHTRGDTVFFVEGDNVLFAGDVVMSAFPAFASPYFKRPRVACRARSARGDETARHRAEPRQARRHRNNRAVSRVPAVGAVARARVESARNVRRRRGPDYPDGNAGQVPGHGAAGTNRGRRQIGLHRSDIGFAVSDTRIAVRLAMMVTNPRSVRRAAVCYNAEL